MIKLNGSTQREFLFPSAPQVALSYFSDLNRVAHLLPHITVVEEYGPNELRVHFQSVELGAYTINIFADIHSVVYAAEETIVIRPLKDKKPVKDDASLNTTAGYGYFASIARFSADGDRTRIDYELKIFAQLLRPRGLRMMPGRVVDRIANSISQGRVREIAEGFMENAIAAFPAWLVEKEQLTA